MKTSWAARLAAAPAPDPMNVAQVLAKVEAKQQQRRTALAANMEQAEEPVVSTEEEEAVSRDAEKGSETKEQKGGEKGDEGGQAVKEDEGKDSWGGDWITPSNITAFDNAVPVEASGLLEKKAKVNSTVACVTTDYGMQNVLLQMGLRVYAVNGLEVRTLRSWIQQCHVCEWYV